VTGDWEMEVTEGPPVKDHIPSPFLPSQYAMATLIAEKLVNALQFIGGGSSSGIWRLWEELVVL